MMSDQTTQQIINEKTNIPSTQSSGQTPVFATPSPSALPVTVSLNTSSCSMLTSPVHVTPLTSPKVEFLKHSEGHLSVASSNKTGGNASSTSSTPAVTPLSQQRRSSSRSIKRPKFDDELVETSGLKRSSSRKNSESSPSDTRSRKSVSKQTSSLQPKKKLKKIKAKPVPVDFGRWRPTDDLALIVAVSQTCDLQSVFLGIRFSCHFTLKEVQDRWFALLYDPLVSKLAQQSIKALPAEVVEKVTVKSALWSKDEDQLLADISQEDNYDLNDFQTLLDENPTTFHRSRTAAILEDHWKLLRHYHLLSSQLAKNISSTVCTLQDMENRLVDDQINRSEDDELNQELSFTDRAHKREIRRLEQEIPQWEVMLEKSGYIEDLEVSTFPEDTLAVLKGRILKFHIVKETTYIGRRNLDFDIDVDLSVEGPALKISRRQGLLKLVNGRFHLENCGRRPFYINGQPLASGASTTLMNNSVIEIYCTKLLFNVNQKAVQKRLSETKTIKVKEEAEQISIVT